MLGFGCGHCLLLLDDRLQDVSAVDIGGRLVLQPVLREGALAATTSSLASHGDCRGGSTHCSNGGLHVGEYYNHNEMAQKCGDYIP